MYVVLGASGHVGSAVADVGDTHALRAMFRTGRRALLLNPPAPVDGDTVAEEHRTVEAIVAALDGSGLERIVAESTYGAQPRRADRRSERPMGFRAGWPRSRSRRRSCARPIT